jgi:hypothetical protein
VVGDPSAEPVHDVLRRRDASGRWPFFADEAEPLAEAMAARGEFALEVPADVATSGREPAEPGLMGRVRVEWGPDVTMRGRVFSSRYAAATRLEGRLEPGPTADAMVLRGTVRNRTHRMYAWLLSPGAVVFLALGLLAGSGGEVGIAVVALGVALALAWFVWSTRSDGLDTMAVDLVTLGNSLWSAAVVDDPVAVPPPPYEPTDADVAVLLDAVGRLERGAGDPAYDALERDNHPVTNADLAELLRSSAATRTFIPELVTVAEEVRERLA